MIYFHSTKKKKMADKILPQRVSINQTTVHKQSINSSFDYATSGSPCEL